MDYDKEKEFDEKYGKICESFVKYELPFNVRLVQKCTNCRELTAETKILWDTVQDREFCDSCHRPFSEDEIVELAELEEGANADPLEL